VSMITVGQQAAAETDVIDFLTKRDLELVDSVNQTHSGVAGVLDHTQTNAGKALLREMLSNPLTDVSIIIQRQQAIKALVDDPELLKTIKDQLACVALYENSMTFFDPEQTPISLSTVIQSFQYSTSFLKRFNASAFALDARHITHSFSPLIVFIFEFGVLHFAGEYLTSHSHDGHDHHDHGHDHDGHDCVQCMEAHPDSSWIVKTLVNLAKAGHIALHLVNIKDMVEFISAKMAVMNLVYQELRSLHEVVHTTDHICQTVRKNQALDGIIATEALTVFDSFLHNDYFVEMPGEDNCLSLDSLVGPTLVAYAEAQKNSEALTTLRDSIALLDVYCSLASVIIDAQGKKAHFCFAEFIDSSEPYLDMVDGWHVMLAPEKVVTNTFSAVGSRGGKYVLSGPNWSGKSSFLRTLGLNVVLAQSFGIAASDRFVLKPCNKILSFMTIADDMATGQSSFVARMVRADAVTAQQSALQPNECALVLLDDSVGQGTVAERGEAIAYEFIKHMGAYKNNIVLAATHFDRVKSLGSENDSCFGNVRMRVVVDSDGVSHGSYVLEPGISNAQEVGVLT